MLHGSQVGSLLKQSTRERIAESVRMDVLNAAQWPEPRDLFLQSSDRFFDAAIQQEQVTGREFIEGVDDFDRQLDSDNHAGLGGAQHDASGLPVDPVAVKRGGISKAQAGVEQQQDEGTESVIGTGKQCRDFFGREWQSWFRSWYREFHGRRRVSGDPSVTDGEGEERADLDQFLPGGRSADAAGTLEGGDCFDADTREGNVANEIQQVVEHDAVTGQRTSGEMPSAAVGKVEVDSLRQSDGWRFNGLVASRSNTPESLIPVASLEAVAAAGAVVICPNGALTVDSGAALGGLRTGGDVAAVGLGHDGSGVQIDVRRLTAVSLCADKLSVVNGLVSGDGFIS